MAPSPYCLKCFTSRGCGNYHLYVIELDFELTKNWKFMKPNIHFRKDMDALYVGSTSHSCECRFKQHQLHAKKELDGYCCVCNGKENYKKFVRAGGHTRGNYYAGVYGLRLRPDLFFKYNPIVDQNYSMAMETKLAETLRAKGYAVWQR